MASITFNATIIKGTGLKPVDSNGKSDPYIKVYFVDPTGHKTEIHKTKNLNPQWDDKFSAQIKIANAAPGSSFFFEVKDYNVFGGSKSLGSTSLPANLLNGAPQNFVLKLAQGQIEVQASIPGAPVPKAPASSHSPQATPAPAKAATPPASSAAMTARTEPTPTPATETSPTATEEAKPARAKSLLEEVAELELQVYGDWGPLAPFLTWLVKPTWTVNNETGAMEYRSKTRLWKWAVYLEIGHKPLDEIAKARIPAADLAVLEREEIAEPESGLRFRGKVGSELVDVRLFAYGDEWLGPNMVRIAFETRGPDYPLMHEKWLKHVNSWFALRPKYHTWGAVCVKPPAESWKTFPGGADHVIRTFFSPAFWRSSLSRYEGKLSFQLESPFHRPDEGKVDKFVFIEKMFDGPIPQSLRWTKEQERIDELVPSLVKSTVKLASLSPAQTYVGPRLLKHRECSCQLTGKLDDGSEAYIYVISDESHLRLSEFISLAMYITKGYKSPPSSSFIEPLLYYTTWTSRLKGYKAWTTKNFKEVALGKVSAQFWKDKWTGLPCSDFQL